MIFGCKIRRSFTTLSYTYCTRVQYCTCTVSPLGPTTFIRQRTVRVRCTRSCSCTFVLSYESTKVLPYNVVRKYESTFVSICEDRIVVHYVHCTRTVRVQLYTYPYNCLRRYVSTFVLSYLRTKVRRYYLRIYEGTFVLSYESTFESSYEGPNVYPCTPCTGWMDRAQS